MLCNGYSVLLQIVAQVQNTALKDGTVQGKVTDVFNEKIKLKFNQTTLFSSQSINT